VERPAQAVQIARKKVREQTEAIELLKGDRSPANASKLETLTTQLAFFEETARTAEKAARQRSAEFGIMRNDIFGTDKVVSEASARLRARNVSDEKIRAFESRAARAATPAQVETMEKEVR
jgi:hypothetical protein